MTHIRDHVWAFERGTMNAQLAQQLLARAKELYSQTVKDRRHIHANPEVGEHLPQTTAYLMQRLQEIGLEPELICESGIVALVEGEHPGRTYLLRADFDALPMQETSGLDFASTNGAVHACGHDLHASMLLAAAQLLHEHRHEMHGRVKLMFQPAEELGVGAKHMIEAGVLENPKVDAASGIHVWMGHHAPGVSVGKGVIMSSADLFTVKIQGKGCHGAQPHLGVDPLFAATQIYAGFQNIIARVVNPANDSTLTFGRFQAGNALNVIPETAELGGTLRTTDPAEHDLIIDRMKAVCTGVEQSCNVKVDFGIQIYVPQTSNDPELEEELTGYVDMIEPGFVKERNFKTQGSEDFSWVGMKVPAVFYLLSAQPKGDGSWQLHDPAIHFDEQCLPYGAALHAVAALGYLAHHADE